MLCALLHDSNWKCWIVYVALEMEKKKNLCVCDFIRKAIICFFLLFIIRWTAEFWGLPGDRSTSFHLIFFVCGCDSLSTEACAYLSNTFDVKVYITKCLPLTVRKKNEESPQINEIIANNHHIGSLWCDEIFRTHSSVYSTQRTIDTYAYILNHSHHF